jgi:hypothetical protein
MMVNKISSNTLRVVFKAPNDLPSEYLMSRPGAAVLELTRLNAVDAFMSLLLNRDSGPDTQSQNVTRAKRRYGAGFHVLAIERRAVGRAQFYGAKALVMLAFKAQMAVRYAGVLKVQFRKDAALLAASSDQDGVEVQRESQVRTAYRAFIGSTLLSGLLLVNRHDGHKPPGLRS